MKQSCQNGFSKGPRSSSDAKFLINFLLLPKKSTIISPVGAAGFGYVGHAALGSEMNLESDDLDAVVKCSKYVHHRSLSV